MDVERLKSLLGSFVGSTHPADKEIERFDNLISMMSLVAVRSLAGGGQLDSTVGEWFVEELKRSAKQLDDCDNLFTGTMRGSIIHNELLARINRSRMLLGVLREKVS